MGNYDKYKLTYWNLRARAEPIRLIFAAANIAFEDYRLDDNTDWSAIKNKYPWEKLPILEVNGSVLAESTAICKYLANKFCLAGVTDLEAAKCDEYVGAMMDCRAHWSAYFTEADEARKDELKTHFLEHEVPFYFKKFEKILDQSDGDFLLGKHYTWADLHIAHTLTSFDETVKPGLLNDYPTLKKFTAAVFSIPAIKIWIETRPETDR